jgi:hypothetical protein
MPTARYANASIIQISNIYPHMYGRAGFMIVIREDLLERITMKVNFKIPLAYISIYMLTVIR